MDRILYVLWTGFNIGIGFNPKARMFHIGDRKDHR